MTIQAFPFSQSVVDIIATGVFTALYAAELQFVNETVRAHTGTGELILDGQVYYGVGQFGEVGAAQETDNSSGAKTVDLTISGLDSNLISAALVDKCRGRPGRLLFVVIDQAGNMAADVLFSGRMDAAKFSYAGNGGDNTITVSLADRMAEWSREGTERWTDENHQRRQPGDRFWFAVAQISEWPIYWGAKKDSPAFDYS
ncbi:hypothetical protein [Azorhizophilus paspali]|uniref:Prophage PssSM-03 n=1 Tax=Azorhizophilus paspali TaxID=69963 RepID=A0ABV6SMH5_AZOPA